MKNKEHVFELFQTISQNYDRANDRISFGMHRAWKKHLIRQVGRYVQPGAKILDVCCGTGDMCWLFEQENRDYQITGLDFSPNMLAKAQLKVVGTKLVLGDALNLPFEDDSFDCAIISFGLRNTTDYLRVLSEMRRVIRPGGMAACLDSFSPDHPWIRPFYRFYFRHLMPIWGGGSRMKEEYKWLNVSTEDFVSKAVLPKLFEAAGFERTTCTSFLWGCSACHTGFKGDKAKDEVGL